MYNNKAIIIRVDKYQEQKNMKGKKIIILITALIAALGISFGTVTAFAEDGANETTTLTYQASDLWKFSNALSETTATADGLKVVLPKSAVATYKREVDFRKFSVTLTFASEFKEFTAVMKGLSTEDDEYYAAENRVVVTKADGTVKAAINGGEARPIEFASDSVLNIAYNSETGVLAVNGVTFDGTFFYAPYGELSFTNTDAEGNVTFTLNGLNGETYALTEDGKIKDEKAPVFVLSDIGNTAYVDGQYTLTIPVGVEHSFNYEIVDTIADASSASVTATVESADPEISISTNDYKVKSSGSTTAKIVFKKAGSYKVILTASDDSKNEAKFTAIVNVTETFGYAPEYDWAKNEDYQKKLDALKTQESTSLYLPIPYFTVYNGSMDEVRYFVYMQSPTSYSWTSSVSTPTTAPKITPGVTGKFLIRIVPVDECGIKPDVNDCPVFELNVEKPKAPSITVSTKQGSETSTFYVGTETTITATVTVSSSATYETLYKKLQYLNADGTLTDVKLSDTNTFTPDKAGTYYFSMQIRDSFMQTAEKANDTKVTITVVEKSQAEAGKTWFQRNWLAVLFIGIAVICLVAIIVLEVVYKKKKDGKQE